MSSERMLSWVLSALVLGVGVGCSDSGGTAGRPGNAGGRGGHDGMGGTAGAGGAASGSAGEGGMSGAGGDDGTSGSGGSAGAPPLERDTLCGERPGGALYGEHVLRAETAAGDVVQLRRRYEMAGVGESMIFRLDGMGLRLDGEEICIGASDTLDYVNTHHNWLDEAHGMKDGIRYELRIQFESATGEFPCPSCEDTLAAYDEDDAQVLPPTPLVWTGFPPFCYGCTRPFWIGISEIVASNVSLYPDEASEYEPLIELYNFGSDGIDLTGWTLSNAFSARDRWSFPSVTLPRHQTLVVFADGETAEGPLHTNFELSAAGGQVVLTAPDGMTDGGVEYGAQAAGESLAYSWNDGYVTTDTPAPGEPPPEPE